MCVSSHGLSGTLCSTHEPETCNASLGYRHTVFILSVDTGSKNLALDMLFHFFWSIMQRFQPQLQFRFKLKDVQVQHNSLLLLISLEQQTVFVAHRSISSHIFPFNIPKLSNCFL